MDRIVYKGRIKENINIVIRYPQLSDVKGMFLYINALSEERTFITLQGEKISSRKEEEFLKDVLKKIRNNKRVMLVVENNNTIIGISGIELKSNELFSHKASFGISIAKDFRSIGIGKLLMGKVLEESKERIKGLKIVTLEVFGNNKNAIKMYKSFGFKEYGRIPKGLKYKGKYIDDVFMYKFIER